MWCSPPFAASTSRIGCRNSRCGVRMVPVRRTETSDADDVEVPDAALATRGFAARGAGFFLGASGGGGGIPWTQCALGSSHRSQNAESAVMVQLLPAPKAPRPDHTRVRSGHADR